jgi:hypothetical protein
MLEEESVDNHAEADKDTVVDSHIVVEQTVRAGTRREVCNTTNTNVGIFYLFSIATYLLSFL